MEKEKALAREVDSEYGAVFNFTQADLDANRAGFVSHQQKQQQKWRMRFFTALLIIFSCLVLFFIAISIWLFFTEFVPKPLIFINLVAILLIWLFAFKQYKNNPSIVAYKEMQETPLQKLVSPVKLEKRRGNRAYQYVLVTNELEFPLKGNPMTYWQKGAYIIYYLPKSRKIMSLEEQG